MKIKARVIVGHCPHTYDVQEDVTYDVAIGDGSRTFKWLGITISERYAQGPNGALRRREEYRGLTHKGSYQPEEIVLPSGDIPHPEAPLSDHVQEGDEIVVHLIDKQPIAGIKGTPKISQWTSLAFTCSDMGGAGGTAEEEEVKEVEEIDENSLRIRESNARFMKFILGSQMLNQEYISKQVDTLWNSGISHGMGKLSAEETAGFLEIYKKHWSILLEIFEHFASGGLFTLGIFTDFLTEAGIFPHRDTPNLASRIHRRAFKALSRDDYNQNVSGIDISGLMIALILCSQTKLNDTYEVKGKRGYKGYEALATVFDTCILPLAEKLELPAFLRNIICSDEFLGAIRPYHDDLFAVFNKYASKGRILPSTLTMQLITEMYMDAKLVHDPQFAESHIKTLFEHAQKGITSSSFIIIIVIISSSQQIMIIIFIIIIDIIITFIHIVKVLYMVEKALKEEGRKRCSEIRYLMMNLLTLNSLICLLELVTIRYHYHHHYNHDNAVANIVIIVIINYNISGRN